MKVLILGFRSITLPCKYGTIFQIPNIFLDLKINKRRQGQGKNLSISIYKMYKEKIIKRKIVNLHMRKSESTG